MSLFFVSCSISSFFTFILLRISFSLSISTPMLRFACSCLNFINSFFNRSCSALTLLSSCFIDCILALSVWSSFEKQSEMFSAGCFDFIDVMAFCNYYSTCTDRFLSSCLLRFMVCLLIAIYSFLDQSSCYVYLIAFVSFAYSSGECTYFFDCSSCSCV